MKILSNTNKIFIGLFAFIAVVGWGVLNPSEVSAYVDNPAVPNAQEAFLENNCPASSTAAGQTIGVEWFSPTNISSTNGSGSTTIYATTAMCTNSNYNRVDDIRHFIVSANRYAGQGNISFPSGTSFPLMNIPPNDWQHAAGPVTRPVNFTGLSGGYNCWTIEFDMSARYGGSLSNITGTGFVDLCVYYTQIITPPTITSNGACTAVGGGYVRARAVGSGTWSYRLMWWDVNSGASGAWVERTLIQSRPSGETVEFDVSSWVAEPAGSKHFFFVRVRSDSTGTAYYTPMVNASTIGYHTIGDPNVNSSQGCVPAAPETTLYSVKIDDTQVSAAGSSETTYGFGLAFGGNCYSANVSGACNNGTLADYPFSDNCVRIDGGACHNDNPYGSQRDITAGTHTISISPAGQADGVWTLRGYKICAFGGANTCTTNYLTRLPLSTGSSFSFNFLRDTNYTMRWIYSRTVPTPSCTPSAQTLDAGGSSTLTASGGNGTFSWSSSPAVGANPAAGNTYTRTYNTEGTYTVTLTSGGETDTCTIIVARKPYFKVYGGDVVAGLGFGTSCEDPAARIRAFNRTGAGYAGAGTQLAAFAAGQIQEFASAAARTSPSPPNGLSFSNEAAAGTYGGLWNSVDCMPDFYGTPSAPRPDKSVIPATTIATGDPKQTIYVDGDAFISGDILYNVGFNFYTPETMPFFKLVAKGNIYISSTVQRLNGIFIAQPNSNPDSGRIYTCAFNPSPGVFRAPLPGGTEMLDSVSGCNRRLIVNGAMAAQSIRLLRTLGSISASAPGEAYVGTPAGSPQAETFLYTPEVWLGQPGRSTDYDAITGLPPIL